MSALTESRKRGASALIAVPDCSISKRMRYGVRLSPPKPSFSSSSVPDYSSVNSEVINNFEADAKKCAEVLVKEMMRASDIDDARNRAFRLLEVFEKSVTERTASEATEKFQEEHNKLKEQMNSLQQQQQQQLQQMNSLHNENGILKRAVAILHERMKENGDKDKELDGLKQTLSQYQEKIRILELNNYALSMHLKRAQGNGPIQGHFNRDIF